MIVAFFMFMMAILMLVSGLGAWLVMSGQNDDKDVDKSRHGRDIKRAKLDDELHESIQALIRDIKRDREGK